MSKIKLIKNAINQGVIITDIEGEKRCGWLVRHEILKNTYSLLPFTNLNKDDDIWDYKVSHIKHIRFMSNGIELW